MGKAPLDELSMRLAIASQWVGSFWQHKSGTVYEITGVSIQESDNDLLYTYRPVGDHDDIRFTRPAFEWTRIPEGEGRPRFIPCEGPIDGE